MTATYPMLPKEGRRSFVSKSLEYMGLAFLHIVVVAYIFALIISTRLLANNDKISPYVVVGVTGVGFPFLSFLVRKALFSMVGSYLKKKLER